MCQTHKGNIYMKINFKCCLFILILPFFSLCFAQEAYSQGETLFKENKAAEAVEVLEYEIRRGIISDNSFNFLGLAYYQTGDYEKSIDAFKRGLKAQPQNAKILSYNLGNTYYAEKNYDAAIESYSESLNSDPFFYDAILNRANALLMADSLLSAKEDYELYIKKCPDDEQRERIELLIKALEEELARREEEARMLAEQNKALWEEYDENLSEKRNDNYKADWEEIDPLLTEKRSDDRAEWEKINPNHEKDLYDDSKEQVVVSENTDWESVTKEEAPVYEDKTKKNSWEEFEHIEADNLSKAEEPAYEKVDAEENWESLSDEELEEMKRLEEESRKERERWLADKRNREREQAAREVELKNRQQQQRLEDERKLREQMLEDMMKAEEERRKKLLEDVANSLQNTDSTNLTSGAEDLLDYDLEGELD